MMRRFFQIVLILFLFMFAGIGAMMFIGHSRPLATLIVGMDNCGETICYKGIELLKTNLDEARAWLQQVPHAAWDNANNRMSFSEGDVAWVDLVVDSKNIVFKITIHLRPGVLWLGSVIQRWGIPCGVEKIAAGHTYSGFNDAPYYLEGDYSNKTLWIPATDDWVQPFTSVTGIDLHAKVGALVDNYRIIDSCAFVRPQWKGFTKYVD
jgi:hypothetical protein